MEACFEKGREEGPTERPPAKLLKEGGTGTALPDSDGGERGGKGAGGALLEGGQGGEGALRSTTLMGEGAEGRRAGG